MKIRIEGHVTPERLIAALEEVATQYIAVLGDQFGGFYGATLDLKAFTCAGQPASFNRRKTELKVTVRSSNAEALQPLAHEETETMREAARQQEQKLAEESQRLRKVWAQREQQSLEFQAEQARREKAFGEAVEVFGDEVIQRCNEAILDVWDRLRPLRPYGELRGSPIPAPCMRLVNGSVFIYPSCDTSQGRKIWTPLSARSHISPLKPYWSNPAWLDHAMPALTEIIQGFTARLHTPN